MGLSPKRAGLTGNSPAGFRFPPGAYFPAFLRILSEKEGKQMEEQTATLLNEIVKNAEMGKNTIRQLLGIAEDERLKQHLHRQLATYEDLSKRAHAMLAVEGEEPQGQSAFTKWNAKMGVAMQTVTDRSPRKIAEMLIEGSNVGSTDLTKALRDAPNANPGAVALAERLQHAEDTYAQELNAFL